MPLIYLTRCSDGHCFQMYHKFAWFVCSSGVAVYNIEWTVGTMETLRIQHTYVTVTQKLIYNVYSNEDDNL